METRKILFQFLGIVSLLMMLLLGGCASSQPQPSDAQVQAMLQALGQRNNQQVTRPAVDFSKHPTVAVSQINGDDFGLSKALCDCLSNAGIDVVSDPGKADVVLSGTVKYFGDPDDRPSQLNNIRKEAQVAGAASSAARIAMGMSSPMSFISSGTSFLASAVSDAMEPNTVEGVVQLHVRHGGRLWDLSLDQTVEAPEKTANHKLAEILAHDAISKLGG